MLAVALPEATSAGSMITLPASVPPAPNVGLNEIEAKDPLAGVQHCIIGDVEAYWWPCMYGTAANGSSRYWMIGTNGAFYFTISGTCKYDASGQLSMGKMPTPKPKSIAPKQGRNQLEQAIDEVTSKIHNRQQKNRFFAVGPGGVRIRFTCKEKTTDAKIPHPKVMLAQDFDPDKPLNLPWLMQEKLDGTCCIILLYQGQVYMISRQSKLFLYLPHVSAAAARWLQLLPEGYVLHGELYKHGWSSNKIQSVVSRTVDPHPEVGQIEYHVYDVIPTDRSENYLQRYRRLAQVAQAQGYRGESVCSEHGVIVHTNGYELPGNPIRLIGYRSFYSMEEPTNYHADIVSLGYEGLILRDPAGLYDEKRVDSILKYKAFTEEETTVIGVTTTERINNEYGLAMFVVQDRLGYQYTVRPRGTHQIRKLWYENPHLVVGKTNYTVIFFGRSREHNKMRFPVGKEWDPTNGSSGNSQQIASALHKHCATAEGKIFREQGYW